MTAIQRLIPLNAPAEWKQALEGVSHAFAHTWESCYAMSLTTATPTYLYVSETDRGRTVCPLAERTFRGYTDIFTPYGFGGFVGTGDWSGMLQNWNEFVKEQGYVCGFLTLNTVLTDPRQFAIGEMHEYNDLYVLDLTQSEEALFASLSENRKRQVRGGGLGSSSLSSDVRACRRFLVERLPGFLKDKGASEMSHFSETTLQHLVDNPNALIIGAESQGEIQSVCLFLYTAYVAEYFAGVSTPDGRAHSAALLWHGALQLKRRGIPLLNLGGGVCREDGIAKFKERFGALKLPLQALKQVYRPEIYKDLCVAVGADPLNHSDFFPPYHRAGLCSSISLNSTRSGSKCL